ncbi:unnamed protein product [Allacma fusca]|uniref:DNA polymerase eta n=1 Tax=Allacma fusca TaxID=39272 RepID=A0A8J2LL75_9HEXA|nr:unnamed protein product [Allacma fusca]
MSKGLGRVIALVDMDCFYVQVEERDDPSIKGVPAAVVQYKAWKGGGIIAVNYEARAKGVTRNMRGDDAKVTCPEIVLVRVPETNEKANLTKYRDAGKEVLDVICEFSSCVERASIDEAYIDLTEAVTEFLGKVTPSVEDNLEGCLDAVDRQFLEGSFPVGFDSSDGWFEALKASEVISVDDVRLAVGAEIVGRMRKAVLDRTGFKCSAGIAHNKILAKLGAGLNKPNKQTVIPHSAVSLLYEKTPIRKVRMLGGQFGEALTEIFACDKMSDLVNFELKQLVDSFGEERGQWLYNLARGFDDEPVILRQLPKSIGCSKNFLGPETLTTKDKTQNWIKRLSEEVVERIERDYEMNNRRANLLTLHVKFKGKKGFSRSCGKNVPYNPEKMAGVVWNVMDKLYQQYGILPINNVGLIASKLEEGTKNVKISTFYAPATTSKSPPVPVETFGSSSPDLFEDSLPSPCMKPDDELERENKLKPNEVETTTVPPQKLVEATNIHIVPATCGGSDDEIEVDIEGFTPDSPQINPNPVPELIGMQTNTPTNIEPIEQPSLVPESTAVVQSTSGRPKTAFKSTNPSPNKKPVFVCTKSPTKARKAVLTKDNPLSLMFPSLSKYIQKESASVTKVTPASTATNAPVPNVGATSDLEPDYLVAGVDTRTLAKEYLQTCDICKKAIPLWEFLNHKDYHVALDLQKKFNGGFSSITSESAVRSPSLPAGTSVGQKRTATSSRGKASKRGRPTKSAPVPSTSDTANKTRTLHSYFLPKN